ncbi:MAG: hypothetical protein JRJ85_05880, partial [Deltaproteobacteria bacterium]|nr:hypothetical protein [Deltaproteobacteria bacterium]
MKRISNYICLFLMIGILVLSGVRLTAASVYFEHNEIPEDSNAISYDKKLVTLEKNGGYLWAGHIYTQQQINAL